jgi:GDPmannose 4,6-dehydratase
MKLHYGDLSDSLSVHNLVGSIEPDEIYNLGAQSHVKISFEIPEYTSEVDAIGTLRILESVRSLGLAKKAKFYQASTSELFGMVWETPQKESTPFYPRSPYAVAKLYSYWMVVNYREAYDLYACNGILFNHESPRRGGTFVTRKITRAASRIKYGLESVLHLGNLDSRRDWGHAKDYVEGMWLMLQQECPEDYVLATGRTTTIRDFAKMAFREAGFEIEWQGAGSEEKGLDANTGVILIKVDPQYYRPTEVDLLLGDATKAREKMGWKPSFSLEALVKDMMDHDMVEAESELHMRRGGYAIQHAKD